MRRLLSAVGLLALLLGSVPAAGAADVVSEMGPGYIATDNVEWLGNIPVNTDSAGGRLVDGFFYISDDRGLTIYDVSDPAAPARAGFALVPQGPYFVEEDLDTNGEIALIGSYGDLSPASGGPLNRLIVIDVSDKSAPEVVGQLEGVDSHTVSCVLDCTYAYNSNGQIIDLTDPTAPALVGDWSLADGDGGVRGAHDVTEVAPGIVVTSSNPLLVLDANVDPASPTLVGSGKPPDNRFVHGNLWPRDGSDRFVLAGGETGLNCNDTTSGAFMTWTHTTDEAGVTTLHMADEYRLSTGLPTEGDSPYNQFCAHWFDTHPTYADGGLVAMGWYEHGTRFLDVDSDTGEITEKGWFYPFGGSTSAAYWITEDIVYAVDYQRGIDILRFTGDTAGATVPVPASAGYVPPTDVRPPLTPAMRTQLGSDPYACPLPGV